MYTIKEELYILFYLIYFYIYLFATLDMIDLCCKNIKKIYIKVIIQIIFWLLQIYITFIFSYHLMSGYVPIYFILFIYFGYVIYEKVAKTYFLHIMAELFIFIKKLVKLIIKYLLPLIYSATLGKFIKKSLVREKKIIQKAFFNQRKQKIIYHNSLQEGKNIV